MGFGFDPRLILAGEPADVGGMARTFSDMSRLRLQQQEGDLQMADMLKKQGQEQSLADIYRKTAGSFSDPRAAALAGGGFGSQAIQAENQAAQTQHELAQGQSAQQDWLRKRGELMARPLRDGIPKSQAELNQLRTAWKSLGFSDGDMTGTEKFNEQETPHLLEQIRALGTPTAPQLSPEGEEARLARAEYERAKADALRRGPASGDPAKAENLRLRNQKLRNDMGGGGTGKQLSSTALGELADYDTADKQLDDLFAKAEAEHISGLGAKVNQAVTDALGLQSTDAARFEGASAPVRQGVGTILEGGKLAAGDEAKYKNMLPKYGDSREVLAEKKKSLKAYLQTRKAERAKSLEAGGYNVPGAGPKAGPPAKRIRDTKTGRTGTWDGKSPLPPGVEVVDG